MNFLKILVLTLNSTHSSRYDCLKLCSVFFCFFLNINFSKPFRAEWVKQRHCFYPKTFGNFRKTWEGGGWDLCCLPKWVEREEINAILKKIKLFEKPSLDSKFVLVFEICPFKVAKHHSAEWFNVHSPLNELK